MNRNNIIRKRERKSMFELIAAQFNHRNFCRFMSLFIIYLMISLTFNVSLAYAQNEATEAIKSEDPVEGCVKNPSSCDWNSLSQEDLQRVLAADALDINQIPPDIILANIDALGSRVNQLKNYEAFQNPADLQKLLNYLDASRIPALTGDQIDNALKGPPPGTLRPDQRASLNSGQLATGDVISNLGDMSTELANPAFQSQLSAALKSKFGLGFDVDFSEYSGDKFRVDSNGIVSHCDHARCDTIDLNSLRSQNLKSVNIVTVGTGEHGKEHGFTLVTKKEEIRITGSSDTGFSITGMVDGKAVTEMNGETLNLGGGSYTITGCDTATNTCTIALTDGSTVGYDGISMKCKEAECSWTLTTYTDGSVDVAMTGQQQVSSTNPKYQDLSASAFQDGSISLGLGKNVNGYRDILSISGTNAHLDYASVDSLKDETLRLDGSFILNLDANAQPVDLDLIGRSSWASVGDDRIGGESTLYSENRFGAEDINRKIIFQGGAPTTLQEKERTLKEYDERRRELIAQLGTEDHHEVIALDNKIHNLQKDYDLEYQRFLADYPGYAGVAYISMVSTRDRSLERYENGQYTWKDSDANHIRVMSVGDNYFQVKDERVWAGPGVIQGIDPSGAGSMFSTITPTSYVENDFDFAHVWNKVLVDGREIEFENKYHKDSDGDYHAMMGTPDLPANANLDMPTYFRVLGPVTRTKTVNADGVIEYGQWQSGVFYVDPLTVEIAHFLGEGKDYVSLAEVNEEREYEIRLLNVLATPGGKALVDQIQGISDRCKTRSCRKNLEPILAGFSTDIKANQLLGNIDKTTGLYQKQLTLGEGLRQVDFDALKTIGDTKFDGFWTSKRHTTEAHDLFRDTKNMLDLIDSIAGREYGEINFYFGHNKDDAAAMDLTVKTLRELGDLRQAAGLMTDKSYDNLFDKNSQQYTLDLGQIYSDLYGQTKDLFMTDAMRKEGERGYLDKAAEMFSKLTDPVQKGWQLGNLYNTASQYDKALQNYNDALKGAQGDSRNAILQSMAQAYLNKQGYKSEGINSYGELSAGLQAIVDLMKHDQSLSLTQQDVARLSDEFIASQWVNFLNKRLGEAKTAEDLEKLFRLSQERLPETHPEVDTTDYYLFMSRLYNQMGRGEEADLNFNIYTSKKFNELGTTIRSGTYADVIRGMDSVIDAQEHLSNLHALNQRWFDSLESLDSSRTLDPRNVYKYDGQESGILLQWGQARPDSDIYKDSDAMALKAIEGAMQKMQEARENQDLTSAERDELIKQMNSFRDSMLINRMNALLGVKQEGTTKDDLLYFLEKFSGLKKEQSEALSKGMQDRIGENNQLQMLLDAFENKMVSEAALDNLVKSNNLQNQYNSRLEQFLAGKGISLDKYRKMTSADQNRLSKEFSDSSKEIQDLRAQLSLTSATANRDIAIALYGKTAKALPYMRDYALTTTKLSDLEDYFSTKEKLGIARDADDADAFRIYNARRLERANDLARSGNLDGAKKDLEYVAKNGPTAEMRAGAQKSLTAIDDQIKLRDAAALADSGDLQGARDALLRLKDSSVKDQAEKLLKNIDSRIQRVKTIEVENQRQDSLKKKDEEIEKRLNLIGSRGWIVGGTGDQDDQAREFFTLISQLKSDEKRQEWLGRLEAQLANDQRFRAISAKPAAQLTDEERRFAGVYYEAMLAKLNLLTGTDVRNRGIDNLDIGSLDTDTYREVLKVFEMTRGLSNRAFTEPDSGFLVGWLEELGRHANRDVTSTDRFFDQTALDNHLNSLENNLRSRATEDSFSVGSSLEGISDLDGLFYAAQNKDYNRLSQDFSIDFSGMNRQQMESLASVLMASAIQEKVELALKNNDVSGLEPILQSYVDNQRDQNNLINIQQALFTAGSAAPDLRDRFLKELDAFYKGPAKEGFNLDFNYMANSQRIDLYDGLYGHGQATETIKILQESGMLTEDQANSLGGMITERSLKDQQRAQEQRRLAEIRQADENTGYSGVLNRWIDASDKIGHMAGSGIGLIVDMANGVDAGTALRNYMNDATGGIAGAVGIIDAGLGFIFTPVMDVLNVGDWYYLQQTQGMRQFGEQEHIINSRYKSIETALANAMSQDPELLLRGIRAQYGGEPLSAEDSKKLFGNGFTQKDLNHLRNIDAENRGALSAMLAKRSADSSSEFRNIDTFYTALADNYQQIRDINRFSKEKWGYDEDGHHMFGDIWYNQIPAGATQPVTAITQALKNLAWDSWNYDDESIHDQTSTFREQSRAIWNMEALGLSATDVASMENEELKRMLTEVNSKLNPQQISTMAQNMRSAADNNAQLLLSRAGDASRMGDFAGADSLSAKAYSTLADQAYYLNRFDDAVNYARTAADLDDDYSGDYAWMMTKTIATENAIKVGEAARQVGDLYVVMTVAGATFSKLQNGLTRIIPQRWTGIAPAETRVIDQMIAREASLGTTNMQAIGNMAKNSLKEFNKFYNPLESRAWTMNLELGAVHQAIEGVSSSMHGESMGPYDPNSGEKALYFNIALFAKHLYSAAKGKGTGPLETRPEYETRASKNTALTTSKNAQGGTEHFIGPEGNRIRINGESVVRDGKTYTIEVETTALGNERIMLRDATGQRTQIARNSILDLQFRDPVLSTRIADMKSQIRTDALMEIARNEVNKNLDEIARYGIPKGTTVREEFDTSTPEGLRRLSDQMSVQRLLESSEYKALSSDKQREVLSLHDQIISRSFEARASDIDSRLSKARTDLSDMQTRGLDTRAIDAQRAIVLDLQKAYGAESNKFAEMQRASLSEAKKHLQSELDTRGLFSRSQAEIQRSILENELRSKMLEFGSKGTEKTDREYDIEIAEIRLKDLESRARTSENAEERQRLSEQAKTQRSEVEKMRDSLLDIDAQYLQTQIDTHRAQAALLEATKSRLSKARKDQADTEIQTQESLIELAERQKRLIADEKAAIEAMARVSGASQDHIQRMTELRDTYEQARSRLREAERLLENAAEAEHITILDTQRTLRQTELQATVQEALSVEYSRMTGVEIEAMKTKKNNQEQKSSWQEQAGKVLESQKKALESNIEMLKLGGGSKAQIDVQLGRLREVEARLKELEGLKEKSDSEVSEFISKESSSVDSPILNQYALPSKPVLDRGIQFDIALSVTEAMKAQVTGQTPSAAKAKRLVEEIYDAVEKWRYEEGKQQYFTDGKLNLQGIEYLTREYLPEFFKDALKNKNQVDAKSGEKLVEESDFGNVISAVKNALLGEVTLPKNAREAFQPFAESTRGSFDRLLTNSEIDASTGRLKVKANADQEYKDLVDELNKRLDVLEQLMRIKEGWPSTQHFNAAQVEFAVRFLQASNGAYEIGTGVGKSSVLVHMEAMFDTGNGRKAMVVAPDSTKLQEMVGIRLPNGEYSRLRVLFNENTGKRAVVIEKGRTDYEKIRDSLRDADAIYTTPEFLLEVKLELRKQFELGPKADANRIRTLTEIYDTVKRNIATIDEIHLLAEANSRLRVGGNDRPASVENKVAAILIDEIFKRAQIDVNNPAQVQTRIDVEGRNIEMPNPVLTEAGRSKFMAEAQKLGITTEAGLLKYLKSRAFRDKAREWGITDYNADTVFTAMRSAGLTNFEGQGMTASTNAKLEAMRKVWEGDLGYEPGQGGSQGRVVPISFYRNAPDMRLGNEVYSLAVEIEWAQRIKEKPNLESVKTSGDATSVDYYSIVRDITSSGRLKGFSGSNMNVETLRMMFGIEGQYSLNPMAKYFSDVMPELPGGFRSEPIHTITDRKVTIVNNIEESNMRGKSVVDGTGGTDGKLTRDKFQRDNIGLDQLISLTESGTEWVHRKYNAETGKYTETIMTATEAKKFIDGKNLAEANIAILANKGNKFGLDFVVKGDFMVLTDAKTDMNSVIQALGRADRGIFENEKSITHIGSESTVRELFDLYQRNGKENLQRSNLQELESAIHSMANDIIREARDATLNQMSAEGTTAERRAELQSQWDKLQEAIKTRRQEQGYEQFLRTAKAEQSITYLQESLAREYESVRRLISELSLQGEAKTILETATGERAPILEFARTENQGAKGILNAKSFAEFADIFRGRVTREMLPEYTAGTSQVRSEIVSETVRVAEARDVAAQRMDTAVREVGERVDIIRAQNRGRDIETPNQAAFAPLFFFGHSDDKAREMYYRLTNLRSMMGPVSSALAVFDETISAESLVDMLMSVDANTIQIATPTWEMTTSTLQSLQEKGIIGKINLQGQTASFQFGERQITIQYLGNQQTINPQEMEYQVYYAAADLTPQQIESGISGLQQGGFYINRAETGQVHVADGLLPVSMGSLNTLPSAVQTAMGLSSPNALAEQNQHQLFTKPGARSINDQNRPFLTQIMDKLNGLNQFTQEGITSQTVSQTITEIAALIAKLPAGEQLGVASEIAHYLGSREFNELLPATAVDSQSQYVAEFLDLTANVALPAVVTAESAQVTPSAPKIPNFISTTPKTETSFDLAPNTYVDRNNPQNSYTFNDDGTITFGEGADQRTYTLTHVGDQHYFISNDNPQEALAFRTVTTSVGEVVKETREIGVINLGNEVRSPGWTDARRAELSAERVRDNLLLPGEAARYTVIGDKAQGVTEFEEFVSLLMTDPRAARASNSEAYDYFVENYEDRVRELQAKVDELQQERDQLEKDSLRQRALNDKIAEIQASIAFEGTPEPQQAAQYAPLLVKPTSQIVTEAFIDADMQALIASQEAVDLRSLNVNQRSRIIEEISKAITITRGEVVVSQGMDLDSVIGNAIKTHAPSLFERTEIKDQLVETVWDTITDRHLPKQFTAPVATLNDDRLKEVMQLELTPVSEPAAGPAEPEASTEPKAPAAEEAPAQEAPAQEPVAEAPAGFTDEQSKALTAALTSLGLNTAGIDPVIAWDVLRQISRETLASNPRGWWNFISNSRASYIRGIQEKLDSNSQDPTVQAQITILEALASKGRGSTRIMQDFLNAARQNPRTIEEAKASAIYQFQGVISDIQKEINKWNSANHDQQIELTENALVQTYEAMTKPNGYLQNLKKGGWFWGRMLPRGGTAVLTDARKVVKEQSYDPTNPSEYIASKIIVDQVGASRLVAAIKYGFLGQIGGAFGAAGLSTAVGTAQTAGYAGKVTAAIVLGGGALTTALGIPALATAIGYIKSSPYSRALALEKRFSDAKKAIEGLSQTSAQQPQQAQETPEMKTSSISKGQVGHFEYPTSNGRLLGFTSIGGRQSNEDAIASYSDPSNSRTYLVVGDGVGGHSAGEVASDIFAETALKTLKSKAGQEDAIHDAFVSAAIQIDLSRTPDKSNMGTTGVIVEIEGDIMTHEHHGDSKIMVFGKDGKIKYITIEHSALQDMFTGNTEGFATTQDIESQKKTNLLASAILSSVSNDPGQSKLASENHDTFVNVRDATPDQLSDHGYIHPDLMTEDRVSRVITLEEGDVVVVTSDGLTDYATLAQISAQIRGSVSDIQQGLAQAATQGDIRDNLGFIVYQHTSTQVPEQPSQTETESAAQAAALVTPTTRGEQRASLQTLNERFGDEYKGRIDLMAARLELALPAGITLDNLRELHDTRIPLATESGLVQATVRIGTTADGAKAELTPDGWVITLDPSRIGQQVQGIEGTAQDIAVRGIEGTAQDIAVRAFIVHELGEIYTRNDPLLRGLENIRPVAHIAATIATKNYVRANVPRADYISINNAINALLAQSPEQTAPVGQPSQGFSSKQISNAEYILGAQDRLIPEEDLDKINKAEEALNRLPSVTLLSNPYAEADVGILGNKGAKLLELKRMDQNVPEAFILNQEAFRQYAKGRSLPVELLREIRLALMGLEMQTDRYFGDSENPLFLSVRSGSSVSMPGVLETVLNIGLTRDTITALGRQIGVEEAAYTFRNFVQSYSETILHEPSGVIAVEDHIAELKASGGLTLESLVDIVDRYNARRASAGLSEIPQTPLSQMRQAIVAVYESWYSDKAVEYRRSRGISDSIGTGITVQRMVFGNAAETRGVSASGVILSRNPNTGEPGMVGNMVRGGQGEAVVSGTQETRPISDLKGIDPQLYSRLEAVSIYIESQFKDMVDIEFTIEDGELYILQARSGKRKPAANLRIAADFVREGRISREEAYEMFRSNYEIPATNPGVPMDEVMERLSNPTIGSEEGLERFMQGLPSSNGVGTGRLAFTEEQARRYYEAGEAYIFVADTIESGTMEETMSRADGLITKTGGPMSHFALLARSTYGIPHIISSMQGDVYIKSIDQSSGIMTMSDGTILRDGIVVTIDGGSGSAFRGTPKENTVQANEPSEEDVRIVFGDNPAQFLFPEQLMKVDETVFEQLASQKSFRVSGEGSLTSGEHPLSATNMKFIIVYGLNFPDEVTVFRGSLHDTILANNPQIRRSSARRVHGQITPEAIEFYDSGITDEEIAMLFANSPDGLSRNGNRFVKVPYSTRGPITVAGVRSQVITNVEEGKVEGYSTGEARQREAEEPTVIDIDDDNVDLNALINNIAENIVCS
ncbi:protein phosphatase 2C domain-containing protein [Candidatus Woesearchaeota archaeon]|nr:protein phosphatase 2C domain-containing protein [Candidatus Woesearchaeota archaeon]